MLELGLKFTLAYLVGGALGSLLVGRFRGVDIRKVGSGNPGGTNALRTQGKIFALLVMIIDVGKGIFAAALIPPLVLPLVGLDPGVERSTVVFAVAFGAIVSISSTGAPCMSRSAMRRPASKLGLLESDSSRRSLTSLPTT